MKRSIISAISLLIIIVSGILFFFHHQSARESIIFFPIAENVGFKVALTQLELQKKTDKIGDKYIVNWDVYSLLDRQAYLRQDISLLFENGRLKKTLSEWKEKREELKQQTQVYGNDSNRYDAISFHYAELHLEDDTINSVQQMSSDQLYIIQSAFSPLMSFHTPQTDEQMEWKQVIDQTTKKQLQYSWNQLINQYGISKDKYHFISLIDLFSYNSKPYPNLNEQQTQRLIGNLWEGLYKNYFLGIKKNNGTIIEPIGSTIPLICISKDLSHLLILIEASDGTPVKLIQRLQFAE